MKKIIIPVLVFLSCSISSADDWPQWLGENRDAIWRETGILKKFPEGGPRERWRVEIGKGYSGPAVANGRVFITDRLLTKGNKNPDDQFKRGAIRGVERVLCLNEKNGQELWKHQYDSTYTIAYPSGPRTTPVVRDGKVYTLGAEGHLFCLAFENGKVLWEKDFKKDFAVEAPGWGFAAHPLLDGQRLICLVGGKGSTVVAFDKDSGKEIWRALTAKEPGYSPPIIFESGNRRQLIVWHPESINSLNPQTGEVYWSQKFESNAELSVSMPRQYKDRLFVTTFYNGPMMLQIDSSKPSAKLLWRGTSNSEKKTDKLHAIICTPFLEDDHIYGVCSYGQLRCLKMDTGERVWESLEATGATGKRGGANARWANAFLIKHEDRYFIASETGDLIIAKLSPSGYEEISRTHIIEPTNFASSRKVVWSHPAFANKSIYARNDKELVCFSLAAAKTAASGK